MSRVITFSRVYPSYHSKAGQPTHFEYKIARSLYDLRIINDSLDPKFHDLLAMVAYGHAPKHHTIRAGHRWKVGDYFSPRLWSGKPYKSKMIQFAPDIQIKKVWDFEVTGITEPFYLGVRLNGTLLHEVQNFQAFLGGTPKLQMIAQNDGLEWEAFQDWFKFGENIDFKGQILCWNENIQY